MQIYHLLLKEILLINIDFKLQVIIMNVDEIYHILDSYPALRENFEIQKSFLKIKDAYLDFVLNQPSNEVVNHEIPKIIWWCWLQGVDNAPDICKVCLKTVIEHYPECDVILIDNNNVKELIDIPQYIIDKYNKGIISCAHYSDIIRLLLLCKYGGVWMDSTLYCTRHEDYLFESPLFMYKHLLRGVYGVPASNWLISAAPNHPILRLTRDLLCSYWKQNDELEHYFIFHIFLLLSAEKYADLWNAIPLFSNVTPQLLRYELGNQFSEKRFHQLKNMNGIHKLSYKLSKEIYFDGTFYDYIVNKENK